MDNLVFLKKAKFSGSQKQIQYLHDSYEADVDYLSS